MRMLIPGYRYSFIPGGLKRSRIYRKKSESYKSEKVQNKGSSMPVEHCRQRTKYQAHPSHADYGHLCNRCNPTAQHDCSIHNHGARDQHHTCWHPGRNCPSRNSPSGWDDRHNDEPAGDFRRPMGPADFIADRVSRPVHLEQTIRINDRGVDDSFDEDVVHSNPNAAINRSKNVGFKPWDNEDVSASDRCSHRHLHRITRPYLSAVRDASNYPRSHIPECSQRTRQEYECLDIDFEAAAAKLKQVTDKALEFFMTFQEDFKGEIHKLTAYANQNTIKSIWVDKILRNEKYHSLPKQGWSRELHRHSRRKNGKDERPHERDWSTDENNEEGVSHGPAHADTTEDGRQLDRLTTFGEHQNDLEKNIIQLLNCQIRRPKIAGGCDGGNFAGHRGYPQDSNIDDYTGLDDIRNIEKYHSAHKLRDRVDHCKDDLLLLLERMREDSRCMDTALIELENLANVLDTYGQSWKRASDRRNDDRISIE